MPPRTKTYSSCVLPFSTSTNNIYPPPKAIRGAAPSFGVVTSLTVKTQPAPSVNILFRYAFSPPNESIAVKTFLAYQTFGAKHAPPALGISVELGNGDFVISGVYYGSKSAFTAAIKPLLDTVPLPPTSSSVKTYDWLGVVEQLAGGDGNLNTSTKPDQPDTFYAKSLMVAEAEPLTEAALLSFFKYLFSAGKTTDTNWFILVRMPSFYNIFITNINMVTAGRFMGGTQLSHQRRPFHLDRILPPLNSLHIPILRLELQLRPSLPSRRYLFRRRHADLHHNQDARHQFRDVRLLYRVRCPFLSPLRLSKIAHSLSFLLICRCLRLRLWLW